jgi:TolB-like protein
MINRITLLLFIVLAWGQPTTIAVFDLENNGLQDSDVRILTDRLQSELAKVGGYTVVERKKIEKIFEEQKFQMSGCVEECLIEIGMLLGAKKIVIGDVGRIGSTYTINARLVNATTGEIVESADYDTNQNIEYLLTKGIISIAYQLLAMEQPKERISLSKLIKHHKGKILTLATTLWLAWGWLPPA